MKKIFTLAFLLLCFSFYGQANFERNHVINLENGDYNPTAAVVADMDGDNKADIVTTGGSKVMWYKNLDGQGNFSMGKLIATTAQFKNLLVGDIDGDGDLDVLYTKVQASINLIKNNGNGTFSNVAQQLANNASTKCELVDLDGDNDLDVVYGDGNTAVRWLKNNGQGNFTAVMPSLLDNANNFHFTDYTGDGLPDLIAITGTFLKSYKNNGDTTFTMTEILDSSASGRFITATDIDGDNDKDIVFLFSNSTTKKVQWYKNTGGVFDNAATLVNSITFTTPIVNDNIILVPTDVDADGKIDLLCGTPDRGRLAWYKNLGNSTFGTEQVFTTLAKGVCHMAMGDVDADGKQDVVATAYDAHKVAWYKNSGTGFADENVVSKNAIYPKTAAGDMDGDGDVDIVSVSTADSKVAWYKNTDGQGNFEAEKQIVISSTTVFPRNLQLKDIDYDGDLDIIIDSGSPGQPDSDTLLFFKNNGQGAFTQEVAIEPGIYFTSFLADIDNDGDLDLITGPVAMRIRRNNGAGVFSAPEAFTLGVTSASGSTLFIEDIDDDGLTDIILVNGSNSRFFKGTGGGTFAAGQTFTLATNAIYCLKDMDNDGNKDLVVAQPSPKVIGWYKKVNTAGVYGPMVTLYTNNISQWEYFTVDVQDMDGDGDADIIAASNGNHYLAWYENLGSMTFSQPQDLFYQGYDIPTAFGLADFNADGRIDIHSSSTNYHSIYWYKNIGPLHNRITGTVRRGIDSNGCTATDPGVPQILVTVHDGLSTSSIFTNPGGSYTIGAGPGNYTTFIETVPQYYTMPLWSQMSSFAEDDGAVDTVDFCMDPTQQITDLEVSVYRLAEVRPGFPARYKVLAKNIGTLPVSGNLVISYDDSKLNFNTVAPAATSQTGNTLTFDLGTVASFGNKEYNLTFTAKTIPTIALGDNVVLTANATVAGDATPNNNSATNTATVVGSYDPNDIAVREGSQILLEDADEYLHYLIRFQNTGNYYSERVVVKNPIDGKLDWTTMQMESMSHTGRVEIMNGAEAAFTFDAIYLPASTMNEPASHGYIAYKIKPKANVQLGDIFSEQAHIFFDFNPAINTNIVTTTIVDNVNGTPQFTAETVSVYPVPAKAILNINANSDIAKVEIYNQAGQRVLSNTSQNSIDISALSQGIYFAKIEDVNGSAVTKKVVKN